MTSAIEATKPVTGNPTTQSVRDNFATAKSEITALQASLAALIGMGKNVLHNPNFGINQRAVSGTVTLAAGAYGHDRWKAGASGCTYTFASSNGINTLTITAGSLQQVIEAGNMPLGSNSCVLSWTGTAQGKIGAGSYAATGVSATLAGGANLTIEFNTGTLSLVQFEKGSLPTWFDQRSIAVELEICQYYYEQITASANQTIGTGILSASLTLASIMIGFCAKRTAPVITLGSGWLIIDGTNAFTASSLASYTSGSTSANLVINMSAASTALGRGLLLRADATAGRILTISADL